MIDLKPCPFACTEFDVRVGHVRVSDELQWWQVSCGESGAHGGPAETEAEAIAAWNTRADSRAELVEALDIALAAFDVWRDGGDIAAIVALEEWEPKARAALDLVKGEKA